MNRLTTPEGECMRKNDWGDTETCCPDDNCDEGCLNLRIARLADYEDTGLEPDEIRKLITLFKGIRAYYKTNISWDELFETDLVEVLSTEDTA